MTKYRAAVQQMLEENKELFNTFKPIHDAYVINPSANQAKYNSIGSEIMDVIRDYERKLCSKMGTANTANSLQISPKIHGRN